MSQGTASRKERNPVKELLEETPFIQYRSKSRSRLVGRNGRKLGHQLSREEALWFMSLPEKVQRQSFTREEQILLKAACEIALLDVLDETYWSYGTLPCLNRPSMPDFEDANCPSELYHEGLAGRDDASSVSSPWLPIYGHGAPRSVRSPGSVISRRHTRSNSSTSRNFSLPFTPRPETEHGNGKVASWLADTVTIAGKSPGHGTGSKPQFYQDPETRLKLRRHLTTAQAFDEALEFGFPVEYTSASVSPDSVLAHSRSTPEDHTKDRRLNDTPSLSRFNSDSLTSTRLSDASVVTPGSSCASPRLPLRMAKSIGSLRPSERDMTFRMTLTRPELRSPEDELYAWQQEEQEDSKARDPWVLEQLPCSDDVTGKYGAFSAAGKDGKKLRKVWNMLGRK